MPASQSSLPAKRAHVHGLRWWIIGLVCLATLINYIDRLSISILAPVICLDLHLTNLDYAGINTWFLFSYSVGQAFFGKIHDRFGTRLGYGLAMTLWSVAEAAHAVARSIFSLSVLRLGLGLGESGQWPAATKAAAEWFPVQERAVAMGIVNTGAALGPIVATPLIVWLQLRYGWQVTFLATGLLGFLWLVFWLIFYRSPGSHRLIRAEEREYILAGQQGNETTTAPGWRELLRYRETWGILLARFLGDPVWWFYLIWLPLYLHTNRGFSMIDIGMFAWIPYLAAAAGSLSGGWMSGRLVSRGWSVYRARGVAILFAAIVAPAGVFIVWARSPASTLSLISIVLFSFQFWVNNVQTLPSDLFPTGSVGSLAGLAGTTAGFGAMLFTLATGWMTERFSYQPLLILSGILVPAATLALYLLVKPDCFREIEPSPQRNH
jgi:MFS transporter, ACS family, hexuronate transporter